MKTLKFFALIFLDDQSSKDDYLHQVPITILESIPSTFAEKCVWEIGNVGF